MALTGVFSGFDGLAGDGSWLGDKTEYVTAADLKKVRDALNMAASGAFGRGVPVGGSLTRSLIASAASDVLDAIDFEIENSSSYLSGTSGITIEIIAWVRVENAAISVTPRIYNVTDSAVATISGAAACSATATDFSGANSKQTLALTPAAGLKKYRLQITPSAATYRCWGMGWRNIRK